MEFLNLYYTVLQEIAKEIPARCTVKQMQELILITKDKYNIDAKTASAAVLIAIECKENFKQINHSIKRRSDQLRKLDK